jgi:hypothetical protein
MEIAAAKISGTKANMVPLIAVDNFKEKISIEPVA